MANTWTSKLLAKYTQRVNLSIILNDMGNVKKICDVCSMYYSYLAANYSALEKEKEKEREGGGGVYL